MKILIADDDKVSLTRLKVLLENLGYDVILCTSGDEAWEEIQKDDAPSISILDWLMPGVDGVELCKRIRNLGNEPYRYTILLTSKNEKDDIVSGMEAGADDYMIKPFHPHELRVRLRAARRIVELNKELVEARNLLYEQAIHDGLTGALNRNAIVGMLKTELVRTNRDGGKLSVAMLDIDHFKNVNDTYGHLAGDQTIREVVTRLQSQLRPYDIVGRYGGEEFLLIFPDTGPKSAKALAERIRLLISEIAVDTSDGIINITVSIGVWSLCADENCTIPEQAIRSADQALYLAKKNGRNRIEMTLC